MRRCTQLMELAGVELIRPTVSRKAQPVTGTAAIRLKYMPPILRMLCGLAHQVLPGYRQPCCAGE